MVGEPARLIFRVHAIQRMFQHRISEEDVRRVVESGETIRDYPDDTPYPSRLMLGWLESRPVHVVAAEDAESGKTFIITAYEPDPELWDSDFRRRA